MLGGEILAMAEPLLNRNFHPTVIVSGYCKALQKALEVCKQISRVIDVDNIKVRAMKLMTFLFFFWFFGFLVFFFLNCDVLMWYFS